MSAMGITLGCCPNLIHFEIMGRGDEETPEEARDRWEAEFTRQAEVAGYEADVQRGYDRDHHDMHWSVTVEAEKRDQYGEICGTTRLRTFKWPTGGERKWGFHPESALSDFCDKTRLGEPDVVAALDKAWATLDQLA